jgi:hypothetical protein
MIDRAAIRVCQDAAIRAGLAKAGRPLGSLQEIASLIEGAAESIAPLRKRRGVVCFLPAAQVLLGLLQQGRISPYLLRDKPVQSKAALVKVGVAALNGFHVALARHKITSGALRHKHHDRWSSSLILSSARSRACLCASIGPLQRSPIERSAHKCSYLAGALPSLSGAHQGRCRWATMLDFKRA